MNASVSVSRVTGLLREIRNGRDTARNELCGLVYDELRRVARNFVTDESGGTLQPTALVNEVMLRLLDAQSLASVPNRRCFFSVAIEAMKQILIDHHRARRSLKRGGSRGRVPMDVVLDTFEQESDADFEELYLALDRLKQQCPRQHEVIQLRFFGGLTIEETAHLLGVSTPTVERDWRVARAKLFAALRESES